MSPTLDFYFRRSKWKEISFHDLHGELRLNEEIKKRKNNLFIGLVIGRPMARIFKFQKAHKLRSININLSLTWYLILGLWPMSAVPYNNSTPTQSIFFSCSWRAKGTAEILTLLAPKEIPLLLQISDFLLNFNFSAPFVNQRSVFVL